jgi:hypothetical protein
LILSILAVPPAAQAQWALDGIPVSSTVGNQLGMVIVTDTAGGAIMVWLDYRNGATSDLFAQRVNSLGVVQWTLDGVPITISASDQTLPVVAPDGFGGAIVAWKDLRNGNADIYAQRISAAGVVQWTANGVAICTNTSIQDVPAIAIDGSNGAIITWSDLRAGDYDVYAQRVNTAGVVQWLANGVAVSATTFDQVAEQIVSDGNGGAIIAWTDSRSGGSFDIYAQRINSLGAAQWAANGVVVCNATLNQNDVKVAADGNSGAVIAWTDARNGANTDIYAQRVNSAGGMRWAANGVAVCTLANDQKLPAITSDGSGGAIVVWQDLRPLGPSGYHIYAQRIGASGAPQWAMDGIPVCTALSAQINPTIVSDGSGGAIMTWQDFRVADYDVYAQRVNALGAAQWTSNGVPVVTATTGNSFNENDQFNPVIAPDGSGGAIISWFDVRSGQNDVYAQRVESRYGAWGHPEPTLTAARDNPNDQGGKVILNWTASGRDGVTERFVYRYTIWRAMDVSPLSSSLSAAGVTVVDKPATRSAPAGARVVWHEQTAVSDYYWELVGTQNAYHNVAYSFTAPTREDSTLAGTATQYFRVAAEGFDQFFNWPSNVLSAHSVDNLAPAAPLMLTAQRIGNYVYLKWNGVHVPDLRDYSVYRKTSSGVTPIPANFLSSAPDSFLTDTNPPASAIFYIVTATDVHNNQGKPSNEANVRAATHVGNLPPITALRVLQNYPNPFARTTELQVGLPAAGPITIDVYDVAGRKVREVQSPGEKGWQRIALSGLDESGQPLASGVYFFRVHARGETITKKMLIAR